MAETDGGTPNEGYDWEAVKDQEPDFVYDPDTDTIVHTKDDTPPDWEPPPSSWETMDASLKGYTPLDLSAGINPPPEISPGPPELGSAEDTMQKTTLDEIQAARAKQGLPPLSDAELGALGTRILHELGAKKGLTAREFVELYSGMTSDEIRTKVDQAMKAVTKNEIGYPEYDYGRDYMEKLYGGGPVHLSPRRPSPAPTPSWNGQGTYAPRPGFTAPKPSWSGQGTYAPGPGFTAPKASSAAAIRHNPDLYNDYMLAHNFRTPLGKSLTNAQRQQLADAIASGELSTQLDLIRRQRGEVDPDVPIQIEWSDLVATPQGYRLKTIPEILGWQPIQTSRPPQYPGDTSFDTPEYTMRPDVKFTKPESWQTKALPPSTGNAPWKPPTTENEEANAAMPKLGMPPSGELPTIFDLMKAGEDPRAQRAILAWESTKGWWASQPERNIIALDFLARAPGETISNPEFEPRYLHGGADVFPGLKDFLNSYDWSNPRPDLTPSYPDILTLDELHKAAKGTLATEVRPISEIVKGAYGVHVDPIVTRDAAMLGDILSGHAEKIPQEYASYDKNVLGEYQKFGKEFLQAVGDTFALPIDLGHQVALGKTPEEIAKDLARKYDAADPLAQVISGQVLEYPLEGVKRLDDTVALIKEVIELASKWSELRARLEDLHKVYKDLFGGQGEETPQEEPPSSPSNYLPAPPQPTNQLPLILGLPFYP